MPRSWWISLLLLLPLAACGGGGGGQPAAPAPVHDQGSLDGGHPVHLPGVFLVKPYLQLGNAPADATRLSLLWQAGPDQDGWSVQVAPGPDGPWATQPPPTSWLVAVPGIRTPVHRVWAAQLTHLDPGGTFAYKVLEHGSEVFRQTGARARKAPGQDQRMVVVGDLAKGNGASRAIAYEIARQHPDLLVAVGDLVYENGTVDEYHARFFPVYNADTAGPDIGAPFMRGTLMVGVLGNHDVAHVRRGGTPPLDSLAYYYYWDQPLNGPDLGGNVPKLAPAAAWQAFHAGAGERYPRMGNFTFRSGDVHWTVLDSNPYVRWGDRKLRHWLDQALKEDPDAKWRFVAFHHPAFNLTAWAHNEEWRMRRIWPILRRNRVALVFSGHLHMYQRTTPLEIGWPPPGGTHPKDHLKDENIVHPDLAFDGAHVTRTAWPIQIVTGGGGGTVHSPPMPSPPRKYQAKVVLKKYCFSVLDIKGDTVEFRQVDGHGHVVDSFRLTR